jgi:hypothetical protein
MIKADGKRERGGREGLHTHCKPAIIFWMFFFVKCIWKNAKSATTIIKMKIIIK